mmetsp:Transcript_6153/g.12646  ORF Transcript_6153/g.12646 Transcript_6153/m.12646 type:complete len:768 (+) Transcript_6153:263-2566(+)
MSADHKLEHAVTLLLWPPLDRLPANATAADRINLADYIKDDPKASNNSDDWGFVFDEKEYPNCDRSTQEKLVGHINLSCGEQGFSMTVHTWANNETRGTLRIRLKCSNNRRSKCKFAFQICYGVAEGFWYLRRGSGNHTHSGHDLDKPKFARLNKMKQQQQQQQQASSRMQPEATMASLGLKRPAPGSHAAAGLSTLDSHPSKQLKGDSFLHQSLGMQPTGFLASSTDMGQKQPSFAAPFITNPDNPFSMPPSSHSFDTGMTGPLGFRRPDSLNRNMAPSQQLLAQHSQSQLQQQIQRPPPLSYRTLEQSAAPSQMSQQFGIPLEHSMDEREAARSMVAAAAKSAPPPQNPLQDRQVSSDTEDRRNRFIASASRYSQFANAGNLAGESSNSTDLGPAAATRMTRESANIIGGNFVLPEPARRNTLQTSNTSKSSGKLLEEGDLSQAQKDARTAASVDFMYSSSNLTQAIKDELKGFMSSTTSLIDPKKPIPEELKGFMASTNSLLLPKSSSLEESKQPESSKPKVEDDEKCGTAEPRPAVKEDPGSSSAGIGDYTTPPSRAKLGALGDFTADQESAKFTASGLPPPDNGPKQSTLPAAERSAAPLRSALKPSNEVERLRQERQRAFGRGLSEYASGPIDIGPRLNEEDKAKPSGKTELKMDGKLEEERKTPVGNRGGLADHSSNPPRSILFKGGPAERRESGALADYTAAPKGNKGSTFYSSIDTFGMSSGSLGIGESVDDLNKLEGFGQGAPTSEPKEKTAKDQES